MFNLRAMSAVFSPMVSCVGITVDDVIGMDVPPSVAAAEISFCEYGEIAFASGFTRVKDENYPMGI